MLVDLDNTLVDRRAAFSTWASTFVAEVGGSAEDQAWLLVEDADGYRPRAALAEAVIDRFRLSLGRDQLVERLLQEYVELIRPFPGVPSGLEALPAHGARIAVVTDGTVTQQSARLARTGPARLVDEVVVSEAVGFTKPDRRIVETAIRRVPSIRESDPPWMIGDHPVADIAGARDCGLSTGWISHGAERTADWSPTVSGRSSAGVLRLVREPAAPEG